MKKKGNYLDKTEFLNLILKYQELGEEGISNKDKNKLGKMIISLVNHIAMRPNFSNYSYLEEMKSNAIITVWKGLKSFNIEKTNNAFSYFTTAVMNAFIFIINKEKTLAEKRNNFAQDLIERINLKDEYRFAKKRFTQEIKEKNSNY